MLEISIIIVCLILNGMLACAEIAFVSVKRSELHILADEGNRKAKLLLTLKERPEKVLSVIQLGITFVAMSAAAFGGTAAVERIVPWLVSTFGLEGIAATILSVFFVVIPLIYFNVVLGELVPKILALKTPTFFAILAARPLYLMSIILLPIIKILEESTKFVVSMLSRIFRFQRKPPIEEIVELSDLGPRSRQYIVNIVAIQRKTLKDILRPWKEVAYLKKGQSAEEVEQIALESKHTRIPVVDEKDSVIGILHTKEFFSWQKRKKDGNWMEIVFPPKNFESDTHLFNGLIELQKNQMHMAIIYEKNNRLGIVTLEDILEEIVGEIYDEDDPGTLTKLLRKV